MQMQETLTGSNFDHLFSFLAIFNPFSGAVPFKLNQKLKKLTILNFAQILNANSHLVEKELCQILEESVKNVSSYAPPKNWTFTQKIGLDLYVASFFDQ